MLRTRLCLLSASLPVCAFFEGNALSAQEAELAPIEVREFESLPPENLGNAFFRRDLARPSAQRLDDLFRLHPAFGAFRRGGSATAHPTAQGLSLRGAATSAASRTTVLLDGVPLNDPFGGWLRWNRLSPLALEDVALPRRATTAAGSAVSPFAASGGILRLASRHPSGEKPTARLRLGGGDVHGFSTDAFAATQANPAGWEATLSARYDDHAGHHLLAPHQRGAIDEKARSRLRAANLTLSHPLAGGRLAATLHAFDESRSGGTALTRNAGDGLDWSLRLERSSSRTVLFAQERGFSSVFPKAAAGRASESVALDQYAVPSRSLGLSHQHAWEVGEHHLSLALAAARRKGHTHEDAFGNRRRAGGEQESFSLALGDHWTFLEGSALDLNLRLDHLRDHAGLRHRYKLADGSVLEDLRFPERRDLELGGSLALSQVFSETFAATASLRSHLRPPTLNERYRPYRVGDFSVAANENLEHERTNGLEIAFDWTPASVLSARLALFHDQLRNSAANVSDPADPNDAQRQNLPRARLQGLELAFERLLSDTMSFRLAGILIDSEVRRSPANPDLVGNRFAQVPEHRATGSFLWSPLAYEGRLDLRYESSRFDDARNSRLLDDFLALDLHLARHFGDRATLRLSALNLTDDRAQTRLTPDGLAYLAPPRNFLATLDWSF